MDDVINLHMLKHMLIAHFCETDSGAVRVFASAVITTGVGLPVYTRVWTAVRLSEPSYNSLLSKHWLR